MEPTGHEPDEVVLMRFEDGSYISRLTSPDGVRRHFGTVSDWPSIEEGRYVLFALFVHGDGGGRSVVIGFAIKSPDPKNTSVTMSERRDKEIRWSFPYWVEFLEDFILNEELPPGAWGPFTTPIWIEDSIVERANNPGAEARIKHLSEEYRIAHNKHQQVFTHDSRESKDDALRALMDETAKFLSYVFPGHELDTFVKFFNKAPRPNGRLVINSRQMEFRPTGPTWTLSWTGRQARSLKSTLVESILAMDFEYMGPVILESKRDAWYDALPLVVSSFDLEKIEPYFLVNTLTPLLWPHDRFMPWWREVTASEDSI